uniref:protein LYK5-like n=1 Tax=Erigeron canadensis TaxID=72917 RepID=UPI001CB99571|nr:protein LYK5-like [Erigeron canadensis]
MAAPSVQSSTFICNSNTKTCNTYVIYRPQLNEPLSTIAALFNVNESQLNSTTHLRDREVVVPIVCDCPDSSSRVVVNYSNNNSYSFLDIACKVYQGLVKPFVIAQQNGNSDETTLVKVPVKCACANASRDTGSIQYLVTYPVMENDTIDIIAKKFGVTQGSIEEANGLDRKQTIFGGTTLLVPTAGTPVLDLDHVVTGPSPQDTIPISGVLKSKMESRFSLFLIIFASISLFCVVLLLIFLRRKCHPDEPSLVLVSGLDYKRVSPDFLDGMSKLKHSLTSFSLDELKLATQDFSKSSSIGKSVYKGLIRGSFYVAIEEMNSIESAHHVIFILTTFNHFNVVKLEGCCFDMNKSYLLFEFAKNGSLRDCLHDPKLRKQLTWEKRVKIAFDVAEGLHYIHYCTKPTYVHRNISSGNVLITFDWRAKISGFKYARPIIGTTGEIAEGEDCSNSRIAETKEQFAPNYPVDVYAYGVVLLELLSAKEVAIGRKWLELVEFLADGEVASGSLECLDKFKGFMDVDLKGEYDTGDAMCLALLAKCCIQDDPQNRPTMNDVLKALSRIL